MEISVTAERFDEDGEAFVAIKIGTDAFEVNVAVPVADAPRLAQVERAHWDDGALRIGTVADAPAWWCVTNDGDDTDTSLSILVGPDDQTWDAAFMLPLAVLAEVMRETDAALQGE